MRTRMANRPSTPPATTSATARDDAGARPGFAKNRTEDERFRMTQSLAYLLWEKAGKPDGAAVSNEFWYEAEKQLSAGGRAS